MHTHIIDMPQAQVPQQILAQPSLINWLHHHRLRLFEQRLFQLFPHKIKLQREQRQQIWQQQDDKPSSLNQVSVKFL